MPLKYSIRFICYSIDMANFSFDIVSTYDKAEINNVFDQVKREITSRYDFKNTPAAIEWLNGEKNGVLVTGSGDWQIDSIIEILRKKLATRNQSQKLLDLSREVKEANLKATKEIVFKEGISQESAKQITKLLKENFKKVNASIQGEEIRVTSPSKDELQAVMQLIKSKDFEFPIIFTNFR